MTNTLTHSASAAAGVYRALAMAFHQPSVHLHTFTYIRGLKRSLKAAGAEDLLPLASAMAAGLRSAQEPQQLTVEFCRLFFGPNRLLAPPYESVYLGGGVIMGEPTLAVMRLYEEANLSLWEGFRDMPDHVAAELEFLYYAATREAASSYSKRSRPQASWSRRRQVFLEQHLARWVDKFRDRVVANSQEPFYVAAAELLAAWVARDAAAQRAQQVG